MKESLNSLELVWIEEECPIHKFYNKTHGKLDIRNYKREQLLARLHLYYRHYQDYSHSTEKFQQNWM